MSDAWFRGLLAAMTEYPECIQAVMGAWAAMVGAGVSLREPHIEAFGGLENDIRLTWNRNGHYLEVQCFKEGRHAWWYRRPDHSTDGGDVLDGLFEHTLRIAAAQDGAA